MSQVATKPALAILALAFLTATAAVEPAAALSTIRVASNLLRPIYCTAPPGDNRLFIVEQRGVIKILQGGQILAQPFLDIDALVPNISGNDERGLLGLEFHPNYAQNGFFYVYYTNLANDAAYVRYQVSGNPNRADSLSAFPIITIIDFATNHNGGQIDFGPDGYFYIGMGDGGGGGDPQGSGQRDDTLLGKMLRIDVNGDDFPGDPNRNYAIPPSNPFVGPGNPLDEIWAKGVRNPYRWSFDRQTGDLYIADVGQGCWEEINFQPAASAGGENYGWVIMEGNHCYLPGNCNPPCNPVHTLPIHEYSHSEAGFSCSVTGGYVYRGNAIPGLSGTYFFADFCSNQIYSFRYVGGNVTELTNRTVELSPGGGLSIAGIAGFGEDGFGELYIVDRASTTGEIYKITQFSAGVDAPAEAPRPVFELTSAIPNPFSTAIDFGVEATQAGELKVEVYDATGRLVQTLVSGEAMAAGRRDLTWDGHNSAGQPSPSGVYFLRAEMNGAAMTQRVSLVR